MFEDSLVVSRVESISPEKRWTAIASVSIQMALAAIVIALPMIHPEGLPMRVADAPKVLMPVTPRPPVPVVVAEKASSNTPASAAFPVETRRLIFASKPGAEQAANEEPPLLPFGSRMGGPDSLPTVIGIANGGGPMVSVAPSRPKAGPLRISTGLSEGMLVAPIRPVYPVIARTAGIQGAVVVEAVISRTGSIESLHVVSGPLMLQTAALEAIRAAKYRPYKLNGEPVEVQTTITVNFRIGG